MLQAITPKGIKLTRSAEKYIASTGIVGFFRDGVNVVVPEFDSDGTEIYWDAGESLLDAKGRQLYYDQNGDEFALEDCTLVDDGEE